MKTAVWRRHVWTNRFQTVLLILVLLGISGLAGSLLLGQIGLWIALLASLIALVFEPATAARLTLRLYRARPNPRRRDCGRPKISSAGFITRPTPVRMPRWYVGGLWR